MAKYRSDLPPLSDTVLPAGDGIETNTRQVGSVNYARV